MGLVTPKAKGIRISMFNRGEHPTPHLHVKCAQYKACISIRTLRVTVGFLPNTQRDAAKAWIGAHQNELLDMWNRRMDPGGIHTITTPPRL